MNWKKPSSSPTRIAVLVWCLLTVSCLTSLAGVYEFGGSRWLEALVPAGPAEDLHITFFSVAMVWLLAGFVLAVVSSGRMKPPDMVVLVCMCAVGVSE